MSHAAAMRIAVIVALGYIYFRVAGEAYALVSIGLISFAAMAQFAPVVLGGLYWKGGTRIGALTGLGAGFAIWAYTLLLPSFAKSGWLPAEFLQLGPWGNLSSGLRIQNRSGNHELGDSLRNSES